MYDDGDSSQQIERKVKAFAQELRHDLSFPVEVRKSSKTVLVRELFDSPPERKDLHFQTQDKKATAREALSSDIGITDNERKDLFCMFHCDVVDEGNVDLDHIEAVSKLRSKQLKMMSFLNSPENKKFTDLLLLQPDMGDYLKRDADGKVKGTGYFYKACYNNIDNLWLICHSCNIKKSKDEIVSCLTEGENVFGEAFLSSLNDAGGLHEGILFNRIYKKSSDDEALTLNIDGDEIELSSAETQGLSSFIREWFFDHYQKVYNLHKGFYETNYSAIKANIENIRELISKGDDSQAKKEYKKLIKTFTLLKGVRESITNFYETHSSSGSDDSFDEERRKKSIDKYTEASLQTSRGVKAIRKLLKDYYGKDKSKQLCSVVPNDTQYQTSRWREVEASLREKLEKSTICPTEDEIKSELGRLVESIRYTDTKTVQKLEEPKTDRIMSEQDRIEEAAPMEVDYKHKQFEDSSENSNKRLRTNPGGPK